CHLPHGVGIVVRIRRWSGLTHGVHRSALTVRICNTDGSSKGIHGVNHKIATSNSLVTDLLEGLSEAANTPIPTERNGAIAEAGHHLIRISDGPVHLAKQPLRALRPPVLRHLPQPRHAGVLRLGIRLEVSDHAPHPLT